MELFQSRFKEAERTAGQKEKDYRRRNWQERKCSENEQDVRRKDKGKREGWGGENDASSERPKQRYNQEHSQGQRSCWRDKATEGKEPKRSNLDSAVKDGSSRTFTDSPGSRNSEKAFLSPLKPTFLKPGEDRGQERKLQRPSSSSLSLGFRKPDDNTEDVPRWRKSQPKEGHGKAASEEKLFTTETTQAVTSKERDSREKQELILKDTLERAETLDR